MCVELLENSLQCNVALLGLAPVFRQALCDARFKSSSFRGTVRLRPEVRDQLIGVIQQLWANDRHLTKQEDEADDPPDPDLIDEAMWLCSLCEVLRRRRK